MELTDVKPEHQRLEFQAEFMDGKLRDAVKAAVRKMGIVVPGSVTYANRAFKCRIVKSRSSGLDAQKKLEGAADQVITTVKAVVNYFVDSGVIARPRPGQELVQVGTTSSREQSPKRQHSKGKQRVIVNREYWPINKNQ